MEKRIDLEKRGRTPDQVFPSVNRANSLLNAFSAYIFWIFYSCHLTWQTYKPFSNKRNHWEEHSRVTAAWLFFSNNIFPLMIFTYLLQEKKTHAYTVLVLDDNVALSVCEYQAGMDDGCQKAIVFARELAWLTVFRCRVKASWKTLWCRSTRLDYSLRLFRFFVFWVVFSQIFTRAMLVFRAFVLIFRFSLYSCKWQIASGRWPLRTLSFGQCAFAVAACFFGAISKFEWPSFFFSF